MGGRVRRSFTDEDGGPVVYWAELHDHVGETYFADSEDAHAFSGELDSPYAGPSIDEMQSGFDQLTPKQQFVLSRRLGLAGDRIQYTQEEIALTMGIDVRNVRLLEANARRSLRANVVGLDERLLAA